MRSIARILLPALCLLGILLGATPSAMGQVWTIVQTDPGTSVGKTFPTSGIGLSNISVVEVSRNIGVQVRLIGGVSGTSYSVTFRTIDPANPPGAPFAGSVAPFPIQPGSELATPGEDYTAVNQTVTLTATAAPFQNATVNVPMLDDSLAEFNEDILIQIANPTGGSSISSSSISCATITILYQDTPAGAVDSTYNDDVAGVLPNPGANNTVNAVTLDNAANQRAIIGGSFTAVNQVARNGIARMTANGALDTNFDPGTGVGPSGSAVNAIAVYPASGANANTIIIGGAFNSFNGTPRNNVARLLASGALDTTFTPGAGADARVHGVAIDTTVGSTNFGKVYVVGEFTNYNGTARVRIARVNPNGTLDTSFDPGTGANGIVHAVCVQTDGKVLIGGEFTTFNGAPRVRLARLNNDGSLDSTFDPGSGANDTVYAIDLDDINRILVAGAFTSFDGTARNRVARLDTFGGVDATFNTGADPVHNGANNVVYALKASHTFGSGGGERKVMIGGMFTEYNWTGRTNIARLNENGSVDPTWGDTAYNANAGVFKTGVQPAFVRGFGIETNNANVVVGGFFDWVGGGDQITATATTTTTIQLLAAQRAFINPRWNLARLKGGETANTSDSTHSAGQIQFASNPAVYTANENDGTITVFVDRSGGLGHASVFYTIVPLSAQPGIDFDLVGGFVNQTVLSPLSGILRWPHNGVGGGDGELADALTGSSQGNPNHGVFGILVDDDSFPEATEDFQIVLTDPRGVISSLDGTTGAYSAIYAATIGGAPPAVFYTNFPTLNFRDTATFVIADDDFNPGTIGFSFNQYTNNEADGTATITVVRIGGSQGTVSARFFTQAGTAILGTDYLDVTNTVTFGPGETIKTVSVPILDDILGDGEKTVGLNLNTFTGGASGGLTTATLFIEDNDPFNGAYAGSVDTSFAIGNGADNPVHTVAFDQSGNAIIGGEFSKINATSRGRVARILPSGTVDVNFLNNLVGANNTAYAVAVQDADNKTVVGGQFTLFNGTVVNRIIRLNSDGQLDSGFNPGSGANGIIRAIAVHPIGDFNGNDGKIVIAGDFTQVNGIPRNHVARLNSDGTVDTTFDFGGGVGPLGGNVNAVVIDDNGDVVIGGAFSSVNGTSRNLVMRLKGATGAPDFVGFGNPLAGAGGEVNAMVYNSLTSVVAPGCYILGGSFTDVTGTTNNYLVRLTPAGTVDSRFSNAQGFGFDQPVRALAQDPRADSLVHEFSGGDGSSPEAGVMEASDGYLYGTTLTGGSFDAGTIYQVSRDGSTYNVIYEFTDGNDGRYPHTSLIESSDGALYGTASIGGVNGWGVVFKVDKDGGNFTVLHSFGGTDGMSPALGKLVEGFDGFLYGATQGGGTDGAGAVYKVAKDGSGFLTIKSLNGTTEGNQPIMNVIQGVDGSLYGTANVGGANDLGVVYRLDTDGNNFSVLHDFSGGATDGSKPQAALLQGSDGVLYGSTGQGGNLDIGTLYRIDTNGNSFTVLHSFNDADGNLPIGPMIEAIDGSLYGITFNGGSSSQGVVYKIDKDGLNFHVLREMGPDIDGIVSVSALFQASDLGIYGTTIGGGSFGFGILFRLPATGLYVGGEFMSVNGISAGHIMRLRADGTIDPTINFGTGANGNINSIAVNNFDPTQVAVGGEFTSINGVSRNYFSWLVGGEIETHTDGVFEFANTTINVDEDANSAVVTVVRRAGLNGTVSVDVVDTGFGSADSFHYTSFGTTNLVFGPGENLKQVSIPLLSNTLPDGDYDIQLTLSNPIDSTSSLNPSMLVNNFDEDIILMDNDTSLSFEFANYSVTEDLGTAVLSVVRTGATNTQVSVNYSTISGGTATVGVDYTAVNGTMIFYPGEVVKTLTISITPDSLVESNETVFVALSTPDSVTLPGTASLGSIPQATLVIVNDDFSGGVFNFQKTAYSVNENNGAITLVVTRTGGNAGAVSVDFQTTAAGSTATSAADYTPVSGTFNWTDGDTSTRSFSIPILEDSLIEGPETIHVILATNLSTGTAGLGTNSSVFVTINDNDSLVRFTTNAFFANEEAGLLTNVVGVQRIGGSVGSVSVDVTTLSSVGPGSATPGLDYTSGVQTLTWTNGQLGTLYYTNLVILEDIIPLENNEQFTVVLTNVTGTAVIVTNAINVVQNGLAGQLNQATFTIIDNDVRVRFASSSQSVLETAGFVSLTLQRTGSVNTAAAVSIRTVPVDATSDVDYQGLGRTFLAADVDSAGDIFNITSHGFTNGQFVAFRLGIDVGDTLPAGLTNGAVYLITNATANSFQVATNGVIVDMGDSGSTVAGHMVLPTLIWNVGDPVDKTIQIAIYDDLEVEANEDFNVIIEVVTASPGSAILGTSQSTVTIIDNDGSGGGTDASLQFVSANTNVNAVVVYPNLAQFTTNAGKILIAGQFTQVVSGVTTFARGGIARLGTDGSIDTSLDTVFGGANGSITALALYTNNPASTNFGKILIGGFFTNYNGTARGHIARLNPDGSLDLTFAFSANNVVDAIAIDGTDQVYIGGLFTTVIGTGSTNLQSFLARLKTDGTVDVGYNPVLNGEVNALAIQRVSGKLVVGGSFTSINSSTHNRIARLGDDMLGSESAPDPSFDIGGTGANGTVLAIALDASDNVFIGGQFSTVQGQPRNSVAKLDGVLGTVDGTFLSGLSGASDFVSTILIQSQLEVAGRVLLGGGFTSFNGVSRNHIARVHEDDGSLDSEINFGTGFNNTVNALAEQTDGRILVGGAFTQYNSQTANHFIRLNAATNAGPGTLDFSALTYNVVENQGTVTITVVRSGGLAGAAQVELTTTDDVALSSVDYGSVTSLPISFAPYQAVATVALTITNNAVVDPTNVRDFLLSLANFSGASAGVTTAATVNILDDDSYLGFGVTDYFATENQGSAVVTVVRTGGTNGLLSVGYSTISGGTAVLGSDYLATNGTLIFQDGQTNATFIVPLIDDFVPDANKTVFLKLSGALGNATVAADAPTGTAYGAGKTYGTATLTILDDEFSPGTFVFSTNSYTVVEGSLGTGTSNIVQITILRTGGSLGSASVTLTVSPTPGYPGHYADVSGVISFANGQAIRTIDLPVDQDTTIEADEVVTLTLSNPTGGASIGSPSTATLTIVDDDTPTPAGSVDFTFAPSTGANDTVLVTYVQTNGSIIVGGKFTSINGTGRNRVARLNSDGSLDLAFSTGTGINDTVRAAAVQTDGRVVVGGDFTSVNGTNRTRIARLNTTGGLDLTFNPGSGANGAVNAIALDSFNQAIVGGNFTNFNGSAINRIVRLTVGGSIDGSFNPGVGANAAINAVAIQTDGKILIAGSFTSVGGQARSRIARLNTDGNLDPSFDPLVGPDAQIRSIGIQEDGLIVIGGDFTTVDGASRNGVARLNLDGSLDGSFDPGTGADDFITTVRIQDDGLILVAGEFTSFNGQTRGRIARLNTDGSLDPAFDSSTGANDTIYAMDLPFVAPPATYTRVSNLPDLFTIDTGSTNGTIALSYTNIAFGGGGPDTIQVYYNNVLIFDSGQINGTQQFLIPYGPGASTTVDIVVNQGQAFPNGWSYSAVVQAGTASQPIVIGGDFTQVNGISFNRFARLAVDASVDTSFNSGAGANDTIHAFALDGNNGQMLIGGDFTLYNGVTLRRVARINNDGTVDGTFVPGTGASDSVRALVLQPDGRVLIGGLFTNYNGTNVNRITRLNTNGVKDGTFSVGSGANNSVLALALQGSKILAGGSFTTINSLSRNFIARLNSDGAVDPSFNLGAAANNTIHAIAVYTNGPNANKILIGGDFTSYNGTNRSYVARLNTDGSLDTTFGDALVGGSVRSIAIDSAGRVVIGGLFTTVAGQTRVRVARLLDDGSLDPGFDPLAGPNGGVTSVVIDTGDKVLIGGAFTTVNNLTENRIARLKSDGTIDPTINFGTGANNLVTKIAIQEYQSPSPTNRIVVAGSFTRFNEVLRNRIVRLYGGQVNGPGTLDFIQSAFTGSELPGGRTIAITVVRQGGLEGTVSVNYDSLPGISPDLPATPGVDYIQSTGTLTFLEGENTKTFNIQILDDTEVDVNETILLVLTGATGGAAPAAGSTNSATLRIIDNDSVVQFSLPSYTVNENGGSATITVLRTGGTVGVVSVDYVTSDGTATAGVDYTAASGTLIFGDGVTSQTISVPVVNDSLPELNETFFITLQNPTGTARLGSQTSALVTIVDDELNPGQLQFVSSNFSVSESGGSATITVIRTNGFRGSVSVQYSTTDITANSGLDYTSASGTLSFLDGETLQTFVVSITPDVLGEADETLTLKLSNPTGGATLGTPSTAILTIVDDDISLSFASANYSVSESVSNAAVTVFRTGGTNLPVTVDVATVLGGTATPGVDYLTNFATLTFAAGETNKTFLVRVIDDVAIESSETVLMILSNPTGGSTLGSITNATLTILDNDINIHFSTNAYSVSENAGSAAITVVREGNLGVGVTVTASSSTGATNGATPSLDFTQYSTNLIFGVGETNKTFFVPIVNDTLVETNETVNLSLSGATGGATLVNPISAVLTIIDNDVAMQFTAANYNIVESNGFAVITVQRVGATNTTTTVDYSTVNTGTAILGTHYNATNGTLIFAPGQVSTNFLVQIFDTDAVDGTRTVSLRLVNPSAGSTLGTPNTATLTILDDASSISFAFASTNVVESVGTVPITVIRTGFTNKLVSVDLYTVDGTAVSTGLTNDFVAAPVTSLRFDPGVTVITTNITIISDKTPEPTETFTVLLKTNSLYADQINLISPSTMTVSITDDDSGIYFSSTNYSVTEGVGTLTVSLLRTGVVSGAVTTRVVSANGTATGDLPNPDFISLDTNIVFNAGETTKSFLVGIVNDLEIESVETFTLNLSIIDGQATAMTPSAVVTIIDNDTATLIASSAVLVTESQQPPNNALDPNETVTMAFAIQNIGNTYLSNVIATLVETNGLLLSTNVATADYGTFAGGQFKTNNFTFVVNSSSSILATFQLASVNGGVTNPLYRIYYPLSLGTTRSFTNSGTITIPGTVSVPSANPASPYPSIITVSNMTGYVSRATVTLNKLTHSFPGDLDILLVSPSGEKTLLMSDVSQAVFSGGSGVTNITITLDDDSATSLPSSTRLVDGVYHPTDYPPADTFPAPAPAGPYLAKLSECKGAVANGNWSLYIYDDTGGDVGTLQGWTLTLSTVSVEIADVGISATATPNPAIVGQPLTFNLVVTNIGPNTATNVVVTNILPSSAGLLSASGSQGTATNPAAGQVVFQVGTLARNGSASLSLIVTSSVIAQITNYATVTANQFEPVTANNSVQTTVIVDPVPLTLTARSGSVGTNGFQLQLTGNSTSVFVIEASTDLTNWTPIYTNSTYQGAVNFIDTDALNYKLRFYRAIER